MQMFKVFLLEKEFSRFTDVQWFRGRGQLARMTSRAEKAGSPGASGRGCEASRGMSKECATRPVKVIEHPEPNRLSGY